MNIFFIYDKMVKSVINRESRVEIFDSSKIANRILKLARQLDPEFPEWRDIINNFTVEIMGKIKTDIVHTTQIDDIAADVIYEHKYENNMFNTLASMTIIDNIYKSGPRSFANAMAVLYFNDWRYAKSKDIPSPEIDELINGEPKIKRVLYEFVYAHRVMFLNPEFITNSKIISYAGCKMLQKSYLMSIMDAEGLIRIVETPQYLFLRIACAIVCRSKNTAQSIDNALRVFNEMYNLGLYSFATPTLMHAGAYKYENYISCFLLTNNDDSIDGFYKTLHEMAIIAKQSGGIGVYMNNMRALGSPIKSSNTSAAGLIPVLGIMNSSSLYVNQGSEKRPGSISPYLEVWHADIESIIVNMSPDAKLEVKINRLFYAIMLNDYFFYCVEHNLIWYLFSPHNAPKLISSYGAEFEKHYKQYVDEGKSVSCIPANKLMMHIIQCKLEFSIPYILNKCTINKLSMYKGYCKMKGMPILISNLCTEIVEYTDADETACCTLGSINLAQMVNSSANFIDRFGMDIDSNSLKYLDGTPLFDFEAMRHAVRQCVFYLDDIIDINEYPSEKTRLSNLRHRPLGIGVRGLADVFLALMIPFDSIFAKILNEVIFRHMYYYAVEASCELAKERGTFEFYELSPYAEGKLHYDLYFDTASSNTDINAASSNLNASVRAGATAGEPILDWDALKENIKLYGMRNIQLIALMPTKSMAKITNTSESFHPIPHLIYRNKSSSGDVNEINKYLLDELKKRNLYSKRVIAKIIADKSCQKIAILPEYFRKCFKTAFEYKQLDIMNMTIDRAPWVDQSQSFNQFFSTEKLDYSKYYTFLVKANAGLLKTLSYYLVRPPPIEGSSMVECDNENDCKSCSA